MFISLFTLLWTVFLVQIFGSQSHPHGPSLGVTCIDYSPRCQDNEFQCETNTYVQSRCPKTCNRCGIDLCVDISPYCARNSDQCSTNPYVQGKCRKTCNLCEDCPSPWVRLGEECFLLVNDVEELRDWNASSAFCQAQATETDQWRADLAAPQDLGALADYMLDNGYATLRWTNDTFGCIYGHNDRILRNISSFEECQDACEGERNFTCRSVEYLPVGHVCSLSNSNSQLAKNSYEAPCGSPYEEWIFAEIIFDSGYWLGGTDLKMEGEWRWISGENITTGWRKGEPNGDYEDCLEQRPEHGANSLNDWECWQEASFICERYSLN